MSPDGYMKKNMTASEILAYLAYKEGSKVTLLSRNDEDRSQSFPAIVRVILALRPATLSLDGDVVALDRDKISRFQLLQGGTGRARYAVFDCLYLKDAI
jgi:ATP-dependent DNA ligase